VGSIYVRTISIYRPEPETDGSGNLTPGNVGYSGLSSAIAQTLLFEGIPASIQAEALGSVRFGADVPADAPGPVKWSIYIPKRALKLGDVQDRDTVVDDLNNRYQVAFSYWNILGYKLGTIKLQN